MKIQRGLWFIMAIVFIIGGVIGGLLCRSNPANNGETSSSHLERMGGHPPNPSADEAHQLLLERKHYAELADRARMGDSEAAYSLYNWFTFEVRDYGLAYFWCIRAKELGNPKVTERNVRLAEGNVLSQVSVPAEDEPADDDNKGDSLPKTE